MRKLFVLALVALVSLGALSAGTLAALGAGSGVTIPGEFLQPHTKTGGEAGAARFNTSMTTAARCDAQLQAAASVRGLTLPVSAG